MAVVSLHTRVEEYVGDYLGRVAHDDTEVVFAVSMLERSTVCEHGDLVTDPVLWMSLYVHHPDEPKRPAFKVVSTIPLMLVLDGDMEPVEMMLDQVWEQARFGSIMTGVEQDLEAAMRSEEEQG